LVTIISSISIALTFLYAGLILFLRKGWTNISYFNSAKNQFKTKVSIIIAARNEENNIAITIEDILKQNYPAHLVELIVVDDHSTDQTVNIIESYSPRGVKLIKLNETVLLNSYKKKAIASAIEDSVGELIITTDADCRMNENWLNTVVSFYEQNDYKFISSPVVYSNEKNYFERLQTLEFLFLIGFGASGIGNKIPSTCNGANLAYRKDVFLKVGGFKGIDDLASGDDELLLHKVAFAYPNSIGFCKSFEAVVYTDAKESLKGFIQQRKRWASKSVKYKNKQIVVLALFVWLFNVSLFVNLGLSLFEPQLFKVFIIQYLIKLLSEFFFLKSVTDFVRRKELLIYLPILTLIHVIYFIYIGIAGNSGKYNWKGRNVN
jgi:cellulose synthase/poly-beta-1,6-N-acetylglucosamine synthase-like glycosyltransferase